MVLVRRWNSARLSLSTPLLESRKDQALRQAARQDVGERRTGVVEDPGITPAARLRFDVGVQVTRAFPSTRDVGYQLLPERWSAATSYVGPFSGLVGAYHAAFQGASSLRGFEVLGLPVEERYLSSALLTHQTIQTTQIMIPLRRTVP